MKYLVSTTIALCGSVACCLGQPIITTQPSDQTNAVGSTSTFAVAASGLPPLSFQWREYSTFVTYTNLASETNTTLVLSDVQPTGHRFGVVVSDPSGSVTSRLARLLVLIPPRDVILSSRTVVTGSSLFLSPTIGDGTPPFTFSWFKDGMLLAGQRSQTLAIINVQKEDAGNYHVVVANGAGAATSTVARVDVLAAPNVIRPPQDVTVMAGESAFFDVIATGDPPLSYLWRHNSRTFPESTNSQLTLTNLSFRDRGEVNVLVRNAVGTASGLPALLEVLAPPEITRNPVTRFVAVGDSAEFNVSAIGTEPFQYQWFKNGVPLANGTNQSITLFNLVLTNSGTIEVLVSNDFGSDRSSPVQLQVLTPPSITVQPTNLTVQLGQPAFFYGEAEGSEPLTFNWYQTDGRFRAFGTNILTIDQALWPDQGTYFFEVRNPVGAETSQPATLTLDPQPSGTLNPTFDSLIEINGLVRALAPASSGRFYVGGGFDSINGMPRPGIARLHADGSLDETFQPDPDFIGTVYAIARQDDGKVVVGGEYQKAIQPGTNWIIRLHADGSRDTSFQDAWLNGGGVVRTIATDPLDGSIYLGGDFSEFTGQPHASLIKLGPDGTLNPGFASPFLNPAGVRSLVVQTNGMILVGGRFQLPNNPFQSLVRVTSVGAVDPSFQADIESQQWVNVIHPDGDGKLLIGGTFRSVQDRVLHGIARLNEDGSLDESFDPGQGAGPASLAGLTSIVTDDSGRIIAGGGFLSWDGVPRTRVARLFPDGALDTTFIPEINNWVEAMLLTEDGRLLLGGVFDVVNQKETPYLAELRLDDPRPFAPILVSDLMDRFADEGSDVILKVEALGSPRLHYEWRRNGIVVPEFTRDRISLRNIRMDDAGTYQVVITNEAGSITSALATLAITPAPTHPGTFVLDFYTGGVGGGVTSVALLPNEKILVAGSFSTVDGFPIKNIARLLPDGSLDYSFVPSVSLNTILDMEVTPEGNITVGGYNFIAQLLPDGDLNASFPLPSMIGLAKDIQLLPGGAFLVGGSASSVNNQFRSGLFKITADGALDLEYVVNFNAGATVEKIALVEEDKMIVVGDFTRIEDLPVNSIARLNLDGSLDPSFMTGSGANGSILSLDVLGDGRILIGGTFRRFNGHPRPGVAILWPDGRLDESFMPGPGSTDEITLVRALPDGRVLVGGDHDDSRWNGIYFDNGLIRLNPDGSLDVPFLGPQNVRDIELRSDGKILAGGYFGGIRSGIALMDGDDEGNTAPALLLSPESQIVLAGADALFSVVASGTPFPGYQWSFNGFDIFGASQWILKLRNVDFTHAGSYQVEVRNPWGTTASLPVDLTVIPAPRHPGVPDIDFYLGLGPNHRVETIAVDSQDRILIGGAFTEMDEIKTPYLARLLPNGLRDESFLPGMGPNAEVHAILVQDNGNVTIGGHFTHIDGTPMPYLARLDNQGRLDTNFLGGLGTDGPVYALDLDTQGSIAVGGAFTTIAGQARANLAIIDPDDNLNAQFSPSQSVNGLVQAVEFEANENLMVATAWTYPRPPTHRAPLTRLNRDGGLDPQFTFNIIGDVQTIKAMSDGRLLVGGAFVGSNGLPPSGFTRLLADGQSDPTFNSSARVDAAVHTMAIQSDDKVLVGGSFNNLNGFPRYHLARLHLDGFLDAEFDPELGPGGADFIDEYGVFNDNSAVLAMDLLSDGNIIIGGEFLDVNGVSRPFLAKIFAEDASRTIQFQTVHGPTGPGLELQWTNGTLQQADEVTGPWSDLNVTSPYLLSPLIQQKYFRLRLN